MNKSLKKLSSTILFVVFVLLLLIPAYLIAGKYGIGENTQHSAISIGIELDCDSIDNLEFFLLPEQGNAKAVVNLKSGQAYKSADCKQVTLRFGKSAPQKITLADFASSREVPLSKLTRSDNGNYQLSLDYQNNGTIPSFLQFDFSNAIEQVGLGKYRLSGNFAVLGYTITPQVSNITSSITFSLPYQYSMNEHVPVSAQQLVDNKRDHIKYVFPEDTETLVANWTDGQEAQRGILQMLLLSALFGIGISGLIEMALSWLKNS